MAESLGRVWIAMTNHHKFIIEADTHDQAAAKFQEKTGYRPKDWQLELMERPGDPLPEDIDRGWSAHGCQESVRAVTKDSHGTGSKAVQQGALRAVHGVGAKAQAE